MARDNIHEFADLLFEICGYRSIEMLRESMSDKNKEQFTVALQEHYLSNKIDYELENLNVDVNIEDGEEGLRRYFKQT